MKIALIGCAPQCLFFAKTVAQRARELGIEKLTFMDADAEALSVYGGLAAKICKLLHPHLRFTCTDNLVEAMIGADYIVVLRVPGENAAAVQAESLCETRGVIALETHGAGAFFSAAHAAGALEQYCQYAKKYAKQTVKLLNLVSPCGVLTQLLRIKGYDFVYGLGLSAACLLRSLSLILKIPQARLDGCCTGLSALSVFESVTLDGKEILKQLLDSESVFTKTDARFFDSGFLKCRRLLPDRFFAQFVSGEQLADRIRGRRARFASAEASLTSALAGEDIRNGFDAALSVYNDWLQRQAEEIFLPPETYDSTVRSFNPFDMETALFAAETLRFVEASASGKADALFLLVPNADPCAFCGVGEVVLTRCAVSSNGIAPVPDRLKDEDFTEILRRVKRSESCFVRAVAEHDTAAAVSGLALSPGIESFTLAQALLCDFLKKKEQSV